MVRTVRGFVTGPSKSISSPVGLGAIPDECIRKARKEEKAKLRPGDQTWRYLLEALSDLFVVNLADAIIVSSSQRGCYFSIKRIVT